jgi:hypothetical protein
LVGRSAFIKVARFLICGSGQFSTVSFTGGSCQVKGGCEWWRW